MSKDTQDPKSRVRIDEQGTNLMDVVQLYSAGHSSESILKNFRIERVSGEPPKPDHESVDEQEAIWRASEKEWQDNHDLLDYYEWMSEEFIIKRREK